MLERGKTYRLKSKSGIIQVKYTAETFLYYIFTKSNGKEVLVRKSRIQQRLVNPGIQNNKWIPVKAIRKLANGAIQILK
jgi:hypothetical protein